MTAVEYFGPLRNINIPPLSVAVDQNAVVYINGTLYSCGGSGSNGTCYTYDLDSNSVSWDTFTTIPGKIYRNPALAFDDFFWYINEELRQVPVNGSSVTTYDWSYGGTDCAVGNGSHSVMILYKKSSVLMNTDPTTPTIWNTVLELNTNVSYCGCLWFGNTIYVTGGYDATGYAINTTQLIDTDTFEVTLGAQLPVTITGHGMGIIDGAPAVFGGLNGSIPVSTIYVYDNTTDIWSLSGLSLPQELSWFGSVTF